MKVFFDDVQLAHVPKFFFTRGIIQQNFDVPDRATVLLEACRKMGMEVVTPPAASEFDLLQVHDAGYLSFLRTAADAWNAMEPHGSEVLPHMHPSPEMFANGARLSPHIVAQVCWYTVDTSAPFTIESWPSIFASASGALAAADEVALGRSAYALARPPGHHAYPARTSAHCFLNNAALAAERLRGLGARRVGILDLDSHHGNGTQGIFWKRDDVVTVSVHGDPSQQFPWYVGHAGERGEGAGFGCNINYPLPREAGDERWLAAIQSGLLSLSDCDALVIALGFDASKDEPMGFLGIGDDAFSRAGAAIGKLGRPCAIVQEGGYNVQVIGKLLTGFLGGLAG